ncbi:MAG: hypothetical protein Q9201_001446 [Fulgogasparrea decipioides]
MFHNIIRLSDRSSVAYFEVVNGLGLPQDPQTRRRAFIISPNAFEVIFDELEIPVRFLEVLANNNGGLQRHIVYSDKGTPQSFHLLIKLPSSSVNLAVYFRYDLSTEESVCFMLGNRLRGIKSALQQTFAEDPSTGIPRPRRSSSPLQAMDIVASEIVGLMEPERQSLDVRVRELEAKTGMSAHSFDESQRAAANEHNALLKDLHVCEGQLAFFERTTDFQAGWIEWLEAQHSVLNQLRFGTCEVSGIAPTHRAAEECIASSFSLCASFSRERLEQVRTLRNRIRIQLSVVANFIAHNDSATNLTIAEASRRIAFETKRDSDAMKTIAALTMVFLPATFVATLFGMVFFNTDPGSGSGFRVNAWWWVYLAATIPLTMLTVGEPRREVLRAFGPFPLRCIGRQIIAPLSGKMRFLLSASVAGALLLTHQSLAQFSLNQLQPIAGFSDACTKAYNKPFDACNLSDFYEGSTCSPQCVEDLEAMTDFLNKECKGLTAFPNTLIGMFFKKTAVEKLCSSVEVSTVSAAGTGQDSQPSYTQLPSTPATPSQISVEVTTISSQATTMTDASSAMSTVTSMASSTQTSITSVSSSSSSGLGLGGASASTSIRPGSAATSAPESSAKQAKPTEPSQSNSSGAGGNNNGNGGTVLDAASTAAGSARPLSWLAQIALYLAAAAWAL